MQIKKFNGYKEFCTEVIQTMDNIKGTYASIMVAAFYEDAVALIKEFARYDIVTLYSLDIQDFLWDGYDREYCITLVKNLDGHEGEYALHCEKAYLKEKDVYLYGECDIAYFANDCHSRMLSRNSSGTCYEVRFFDDEEEDCIAECDCQDCMCSTKHEVHLNEDMKGFTISSSDKHGYSCISFYSTDEKYVHDMLKYYREL